MIIDDVEKGREALVEALECLSKICFFTGAGISTPSGIPDFRSPGGIWSQYRIVEFDEFQASEEARVEDWTRRFHMFDAFKNAAPNSAHKLIEQMIAADRATGVITQNIDGLHSRSGVEADKVVEFHGTGGHAHCLKCGQRFELEALRERFENEGKSPRCTCGGLIKAAVVSFGEAIPDDFMERASAIVQTCDGIVVMGSSLVVWPAAGFVDFVLSRGLPLIILNRDETPFDDRADLCLRADLAEICKNVPEFLGI